MDLVPVPADGDLVVQFDGIALAIECSPNDLAADYFRSWVFLVAETECGEGCIECVAYSLQVVRPECAAVIE